MTTDKVSVDQRDRDAAAALVRAGYPGGGNGNKVVASGIKGGLHDSYFIVQEVAKHRIAAEAEVATLRAEVEALRKRGAEAIIAYHVAICSPKGVVPMDTFYDPQLAARVEREFDAVRTALPNGDGNHRG